MSLYSAFDQTKHFDELDDPLIGHAEGTLSSAARRARCVTNLGLSDTLLDPDTLTTEAGAGITGGTGTVYSSSVRQIGDIVVTQIFVDLTGLGSSTTDLDIIGTGTADAHLGQITAAQNGTVFAGVMTCVELPATGVTDIDLYSATESTGAFDDASTSLTERALLSAGGAWAAQNVKQLTSVPLADEYLYLMNGAAGTVGTYTAGQFYITLYGIAS